MSYLIKKIDTRGNAQFLCKGLRYKNGGYPDVWSYAGIKDFEVLAYGYNTIGWAKRKIQAMIKNHLCPINGLFIYDTTTDATLNKYGEPWDGKIALH